MRLGDGWATVGAQTGQALCSSSCHGRLGALPAMQLVRAPDGQILTMPSVVCCCAVCRPDSLRKLKFSARPRFMDSIGPLCPVAAHLVAQLSSFSSLTCLCLSGMRIVNGSGVHGDLVHPELRRLILDDTESSGLTVRCAGCKPAQAAAATASSGVCTAGAASYRTAAMLYNPPT